MVDKSALIYFNIIQNDICLGYRPGDVACCELVGLDGEEGVGGRAGRLQEGLRRALPQKSRYQVSRF